MIRGEDNRWRKVRWLFSLLRPYRRQVLMMFGALILATGATLAPPFLVGKAISVGVLNRRHHARWTLIVAGLPRRRAGRLGHELPADLSGRMGR